MKLIVDAVSIQTPVGNGRKSSHHPEIDPRGLREVTWAAPKLFVEQCKARFKSSQGSSKNEVLKDVGNSADREPSSKVTEQPKRREPRVHDGGGRKKLRLEVDTLLE